MEAARGVGPGSLVVLLALASPTVGVKTTMPSIKVLPETASARVGYDLVQKSWVIFAAGAVMAAVFFTFALSRPLPPKEMGIVLGVAVLLDAFLVRLALLPVLLRLTGRAAWWAPSWLNRMLANIRFSHS